MKWLYRHLHKKEKGFTLVELMVVIIILAVLTGIAIPSYLMLRNRARIQATRSEMQNIGTAIEMYSADNEDVLPALGTWNTDLEAPIAYMENVPTLDAWGDGYVYALAPAVGVNYTLTSDGGSAAAADIVLTDGQLN